MESAADPVVAAVDFTRDLASGLSKRVILTGESR